MPQKNLEDKVKDKFLELKVEEGKVVSVCTCGYSKNYPFCDNSHRTINDDKGTNYHSLKISLVAGKILVYSKNYKI